MYSSRPGPRACSSAGSRVGFCQPTERLPVVDMMLVSERTRCGCSMAMVCAIIPPIDTPTTCADVEPEVVEQPEGVVGHVAERVRRPDPRPANARTSAARHPARRPRRATGVAVVVADHEEAARRRAASRSRGPTRSSGRPAPSRAAAARRRGRRRSGSRARCPGRPARTAPRRRPRRDPVGTGGHEPSQPHVARLRYTGPRLPGNAAVSARTVGTRDAPTLGAPSSGRRASTVRRSRPCCARAAWSPRPGGYALRSLGDRAPAAARRTPARLPTAGGDPVVLVPGLPGRRRHAAADGRARCAARGSAPTAPTSTPTSAAPSNAAAQLETRLESIAMRRGSRVRIVGHSLGGMLARGLAVRRPDLVSGIVTLGSPMLAPGAHHRALTASVDMLVRLSRAGVPGLMAEDCVGGRLRPAELRREPAAGAAGVASPRSTPGATASSTGGPASTRSREPVEVPRRTSGWPSTRGSSTTWSRRCGR